MNDPLEKALASLKSMPVISDDEADRREALYRQMRSDVDCKVLRLDWNAPKRQAEKQPDATGPWGVFWQSLRQKLGSGFTVGMIGTRGSGKTQMAVELMKLATERGRSARYCTATEFFQHIKATYRKDADKSEADIIRKFRKPALLVIDEATKRAETDWENNQLFELLNKRYDDKGDTILVCNATLAEFTASIGDSIADRMKEGGGILEFTWASFRGKTT